MARKPMDVQSVIVDASRYSLEEARAKVKKMGYKVTKVDKPEEGETQEHYRFRQRDPGQFEKFRYHKLKRKTKKGERETGVQLVLAKSVHLLVKAAPGTRPHKYVKRIARPGGGFRYVYAEPAGEKGEKPSSKLLAFEERAGFRVAQPLGWAIKEHGLTAAEGKDLMQRFSQHMPHFKMTSNPEKNRVRATMIFNHWAEGAKMARKRKAAEEGKVGQPHGVWASAVAAQLGREIGLPEGSLWVPPAARGIEKLVTSGKMTRKEALAETRFSLGLPKTKKQETQKSFTEDNAMNDELSLSQREGERIAKVVLEDEETRVEKMVKAVGAQRGGKYIERKPKPGGGYTYVYEAYQAGTAREKAHITRAKKKYAEAKALKLQGKHKEAEEAEKAGLAQLKLVFKQRGKYISPTQMREALKAPTKKSVEEMAVEAALPHSPGALVKAVIEVPSYGKTKKKTIPDDRVIAIFKAYIRTQFRNAVRWNEATGPQGLYDRILSGAVCSPITEAALSVLEKRKTPFSVDYVKACIAEVQDAQKEADSVAPEPTDPASIAASGG